jgi:deoxyribonuclease V
LHSWNLTPREAVAIQRELAGRVRVEPVKRSPQLVAGLDAAFSQDGRSCLAGVVLWNVPENRVVEEHVATHPLRFPYVPGLLSFREAPALLAVLEMLETAPDVLMCDGQGIAHPRRFGIASHLGVLLDRPSVGCAKSRLTGEHEDPGPARGSQTPLRDGGKVIGSVLRSRDRVRPLFISVGHRMDLVGAVKLVLACGRGFRLPEPTRLADRLVAGARRV